MARKTDIRLRRSNTAGAVPSGSNLNEGELAINTADGALYFRKSDSTIITAHDNTTRIRWNKNIEIPIRYSDVYDENKQKHITPKWLNLPLNKCGQIVKGLLHTDGCLHNEIVFDNTSIKLVESLRYILLRMEILTSGYIRDRIGESHQTYNGTITHKLLNYVLRLLTHLLTFQQG